MPSKRPSIQKARRSTPSRASETDGRSCPSARPGDPPRGIIPRALARPVGRHPVPGPRRRATGAIRSAGRPASACARPVLKAVLDRGLAHSPTLRQLVAEIEATRILVFAECAVRLPSGVGGRMNFVTSSNDFRFIRIAVDCALTERSHILLLAHELQHTLEIGRHPDVVDVEAMESLYEEIGYPTSRDHGIRHFETDDAIAVQSAVELEGRGDGVLADQPARG